MSALKCVLLLVTQWLVLTACGGATPPLASDPLPLKPVTLLCGQPLPADCEYRRSSYAELPSRTPAPERIYEGASGEHGRSLQAIMSHDVVHLPEVTFALERIAKGYYGDELRERQASELMLAKLLLDFGDDGGAADLMGLLVKDMVKEDAVFSAMDLLPHLHRLTSRCPSAKTINTLTRIPEVCDPPWFDITPHGHSILASLCRYKARGLVEVGEYDEARALFKKFGLNDADQPDFVPQCTKWLERRAEELTPVPVGRPCNCDIEPPKWREGCGCRGPTDLDP